MQRLEVSGAVRLIYRSLGVKGLIVLCNGSLYFFREGLMMIPTESKHVAQGQ